MRYMYLQCEWMMMNPCHAQCRNCSLILGARCWAPFFQNPFPDSSLWGNPMEQETTWAICSTTQNPKCCCCNSLIHMNSINYPVCTVYTRTSPSRLSSYKYYSETFICPLISVCELEQDEDYECKEFTISAVVVQRCMRTYVHRFSVLKKSSTLGRVAVIRFVVARSAHLLDFSVNVFQCSLNNCRAIEYDTLFVRNVISLLVTSAKCSTYSIIADSVFFRNYTKLPSLYCVCSNATVYLSFA